MWQPHGECASLHMRIVKQLPHIVDRRARYVGRREAVDPMRHRLLPCLRFQQVVQFGPVGDACNVVDKARVLRYRRIESERR